MTIECFEGQAVEIDDLKYTNSVSAIYALSLADKDMRVVFCSLDKDKAEEKAQFFKSISESLFDFSQENFLKNLKVLARELFKKDNYLEFLDKTERFCRNESFDEIFYGKSFGVEFNALRPVFDEILQEKKDEYLIQQSKYFSIGYGNENIKDFLLLLQKYNIKVLIDIRTFPSSTHNNYFEKERLEKTLKENGVNYLERGSIFGGTPLNNEDVFDEDGFLLYDEFWTPEKNESLEKVIEFAKEKDKNICFMCSELDPEKCHRSRLIGRKVLTLGSEVIHIFKDKTLFQSSFDKENGNSNKSAEPMWSCTKRFDLSRATIIDFLTGITKKDKISKKRMDAIEDLAYLFDGKRF